MLAIGDRVELRGNGAKDLSDCFRGATGTVMAFGEPGTSQAVMVRRGAYDDMKDLGGCWGTFCLMRADHAPIGKTATAMPSRAEMALAKYIQDHNGNVPAGY